MKKALVGLGGMALIGAVVALILVFVGVHSSGSTGRTVTQQDGASSSEPAVNASQPADWPGGTREGIAVHGHWTVEVRSADGELVSRNEFENALTTIGIRFLTNLVARQASTGTWGILIHSSTAPPCVYSSAPSDCVITEPSAGGMSGWPAALFNNLTLSPASWDGAAASFVLQGNAIAGADGNIDHVESLSCFATSAGIAPLSCNNSVAFTTKDLTTPVAVATGQQILVTVTITFG